MKITIAGRDRTDDLGPVLRRQAEIMARGDRKHQPDKLPDEISALALAQTKSAEDYLSELIRLLRYREGVDAALPLHIPVRPGPGGRLIGQVKRGLWKLLRYQHEHMALRQNLINAQLTSALEFEIVQRRRETDDLKRRLAELEKQGGR
jgi:hypothetical protein